MVQVLQLIGNMGRDPEVRYTPDGKAIASFPVATSRTTAQGGKETTWFQVTCWDKTAEYMSKYAQKGTKVWVEGRLVCDPATGSPKLFTRQDGKTTASYDVSANTVRVVSGYKNGGEDDGQQSQPSQQQYKPRNVQPAEDFEPDIPF